VQTTEKAIIRKEKHLEDDGEADDDDEVIYKIEVAANRSADFCFSVIESMVYCVSGIMVAEHRYRPITPFLCTN
jgi:phenylalanyl-tRNA synthetase beta chain